MTNLNYIQPFLESFSRMLPRLMVAIILFIVFFIISIVVYRFVCRLSKKYANPQKNIIVLVGQILKTTCVIIGTLTALGTMGISITALIASLGLTGFALGFALKEILSNFLSGILIIVYKAFDINDTIMVQGNTGKVTEINLRYTVLEVQGDKVLIPNSVMYAQIVTVKARGLNP